MIDTILRTYPDYAAHQADPGPANVLDYLNRHMFTRRARPSFATVFVAGWRPSERVLQYACAGHPSPFLKRAASGRVAALETGDDIPVQVLRDYTWTQRQVELAEGDLLVMYTDGITEAQSPRGVHFGERRLAEALGGAAPRPQAIVNAVTKALNSHVSGRPYHDDQTLIVARFE